MVAHHTEPVAALAEGEHCLHKVFAKRRVEPRGAHNDAVGGILEELAFALQFCGSVGGARIRLIGFLVGTMCEAVEHIIGADVQHLSSEVACGTCQIGNSVDIELCAQHHVVFGAVNGSVGGAVHNHIDCVVLNESPHGSGIGDVEGINIGEIGIDLTGIGSNNALHFIAKLSVGSGD